MPARATTKNRPIADGDIIYLKSGGLKMTAGGTTAGGGIRCHFFDLEGKIHAWTFAEAMLVTEDPGPIALPPKRKPRVAARKKKAQTTGEAE